MQLKSIRTTFKTKSTPHEANECPLGQFAGRVELSGWRATGRETEE